MSITPRVSVVVPCFNGAPWVETAVRSVLAQEVSELELLLADDASTDDSIFVARQSAAGDPRFRVLTADQNRGMTANWNAALAETRGQFVCKLDCDDAWRPGTLRALLGAYDSRPGLTAAFCRTLQCDAEMEPVGAYRGDLAFLRRESNPAQDSVRSTQQWYEWCFDDIQLWHSNAFMLRRETLVDRLHGWDARFGCASDTDLILRVLELGGEVAHLAHLGVWYRATTGSVSDSGRRQGWVSVEGLLASALSLQRTAARRPLSRHLSLQRRRCRAALLEQTRDHTYRPPERLVPGHRSLISDLDPLPALERTLWRARCQLSAAVRSLRFARDA